LRIHATGTSVYGQDGVAAIVWAGEGELKLQLIEPSSKGLGLFADLVDKWLIVLIASHLEELERFIQVILERLPWLQLLTEAGQIAHQRLGALRIVPQIWIRRLLFELG
jgi:hypothetical protein